MNLTCESDIKKAAQFSIYWEIIMHCELCTAGGTMTVISA